jgi:hypothetical protein
MLQVVISELEKVITESPVHKKACEDLTYLKFLRVIWNASFQCDVSLITTF